MATVVVLTSQVPGTVNAASELVRRLRGAGHNVHFQSPYSVSPVERRGLEPEAIEPCHPLNLLQESPGLGGRLVRVLSGLTPGVRNSNSESIAAYWKLEEFVGSIREHGPDLVIVDLELPLHTIALMGSGFKTAVFIPQLSVFRARGVPPLSSNRIPSNPGGFDVGTQFDWARLALTRKLSIARDAVLRGGRDPVSVMRTVAAEFNVSFRDEVSLGHWFRFAVFPNVPCFSLNAAELEFPQRFHPNLSFVGPMLRPPDPLSVEALGPIADWRSQHPERRVVYCSFGTWSDKDDRVIIQKILSVTNRPNLRVILGLGSRTRLDQFGVIPDNVVTFEYAPQREALSLADIAVSHGGINTVNECLACGVPMVLIPFESMDLRGTAARARYHGVASVMDRDGFDERRFESMLDSVLTDSEMALAAQRFQGIFEEYEDRDVAVNTIEAAFKPPPLSPPSL